MDKALTSLGSGRQRQSYQPFPKICVVRNGLTGIGTLTADEQFARVFCVLLCLHDPLILKSLSNDKRYVRPKDDKNDTNLAPVQIESMGLEEAKKWFVLFQDTVLYHSWLYSESHNVNELLPEFNDDNESSDYSETMSCSDEPRHINRSDMKMDGKDSDSLMKIRRYLRDLKNVLKRSDGNRHKLVKLHQQLHNPRQVLKDGSLLNVDGGRCESIAIHSSKNCTFPMVFLTVMYALKEQAVFKSSDRILIHSDAGGVGLVVIQYAQSISAEIFAMGSPSKHDYLLNFDVKHISTSRDGETFVSEMSKLVGDQGLDVVLSDSNLARESLDLLGPDVLICNYTMSNSYLDVLVRVHAKNAQTYILLSPYVLVPFLCLQCISFNQQKFFFNDANGVITSVMVQPR